MKCFLHDYNPVVWGIILAPVYHCLVSLFKRIPEQRKYRFRKLLVPQRSAFSFFLLLQDHALRSCSKQNAFYLKVLLSQTPHFLNNFATYREGAEYFLIVWDAAKLAINACYIRNAKLWFDAIVYPMYCANSNSESVGSISTDCNINL